MGLGIWFKDDIANILRAVDEVNLSAMLDGARGAAGAGYAEADLELRRAYRRGFVAALATLAQAVGLPAADIRSELAAAMTEARLGRRNWRALPLTDLEVKHA